MATKLSLGDALGYGANRLATRGGAILLGVYVLFQITTQVSMQTLMADLIAGAGTPEDLAEIFPLALDLPVTVSAGVTVLLMIGGSALSVVAIRAVYSDIDQVPTADHTRRLLRTIGVLIVVSILASVAIFVGFLFLFIPGIYLAVCLVFIQHAVVIEDAGVIEALERSWSLTSGNRLRLFVLGFIIAVIGVIVGAFLAIFQVIFPATGDVISAAGTGVMSLFGLAVLVGAYRQLSGETAGTGAESVPTA